MRAIDLPAGWRRGAPMKAFCLATAILSAAPAWAAGFQQAKAQDEDGTPIELAIWYPSPEKPVIEEIGPFKLTVADDGPVSAGRHPLIVLSHGTGGSSLTDFDTAAALADAGFVVAAIQHPFDNYRDDSHAFTGRNFADRARHVSRTIDWMTASWSGHDRIDPRKIGIMGHSAGGATALVVLGARADFTLLAKYCQNTPDDWGCQKARERGIASIDRPSVTAPDARVKAAVLMAPAIGEVFTRDGLAGVKAPIQMWVGAEDTFVPDAPPLRGKLPVPPDYRLIPHGGHFAYLAPCSPALAKTAPEICVDPKGFDRARFLKKFQRSTIAFFRATLR